MENRENNNFYAVPLMGGILCVISIFTPISFTSFGFNFLILITLLISITLEEVCGIILIIFAVKLKKGKTTLLEQKKKFLVLSLLAFFTPIVLSIIISIGLEYFRIHLVYGLTGGFITILGVALHKRIVDGSSLYGSIVQERTEENLSPKINQSLIDIPTVCNKCGADLKGGVFKFCPECGNQLEAE